jgi:hypothetical protein
MARHSPPADEAADPDDLFRRLVGLLGTGPARLVLVRFFDSPAAAAVISETLRRRRAVSRLVLHPPGELPAPYSESIGPAGAWRVVPGLGDPGSLQRSSVLARRIEDLVTESPEDPRMRALWLPPGILEGYSELPANSEGVLVLDDWHALVADYLAGEKDPKDRALDERDLDEVLVEMFRALGDVHLVVATTKNSDALESAADAIVMIGPRLGERSDFGVRIVRDPLEDPPKHSFVLRVRADGALF